MVIRMNEMICSQAAAKDEIFYDDVIMSRAQTLTEQVPGQGLSRDVMITDELGLHARPAARIAQIAQNAKSDVWLIKGEREADAKSMIDILALACQTGSRVSVKVNDQPDIKVLYDIVKSIENGFVE